MGYEANWRGTVGIVNPTRGTGSIEELTRLLPEGIGLIVFYNNIRHGTIGEFRSVMESYQAQVRAFADDPDKVDVIHPAGTPPFMVLGYERERELVAQWERDYGIPVFTSGMSQARAMRALRIKRFVRDRLRFQKIQASSAIISPRLRVSSLALALVKLSRKMGRCRPRFVSERLPSRQGGIPGASQRSAGSLSPGQQMARARHRRNIGTRSRLSRHSSGRRARCWEIQRRLYVRQKRPGYGRLLAEMPLD